MLSFFTGPTKRGLSGQGPRPLAIKSACAKAFSDQGPGSLVRVPPGRGKNFKKFLKLLNFCLNFRPNFWTKIWLNFKIEISPPHGYLVNPWAWPGGPGPGSRRVPVWSPTCAAERRQDAVTAHAKIFARWATTEICDRGQFRARNFSAA